MDHQRADADLAPTIDRACMAAMWEDAGGELFQRLAEMFDVEQTRRVELLTAALRNDDRKAIAFEAHVLRSAAGYVCANTLRDAAAQLERDARAAGPLRLARLVNDVVSLSGRSFDDLRIAIADYRP